MSNRTNLAYDLSRYENVVKKPKVEKKAEIKVKSAPQNQGSAPKTALLIICAGLLLCGILYSKVEINNLYVEISNENNMINSSYSEGVGLRSEMERRTALKNIEDYAENILGLEKIDKSQVEYIDIQKEDVIEVNEEKNNNIFVIIKNKFDEFVEYIIG